MSGFVPMQASWWETIRETLPKPWPMACRWRHHAQRFFRKSMCCPCTCACQNKRII